MRGLNDSSRQQHPGARPAPRTSAPASPAHALPDAHVQVQRALEDPQRMGPAGIAYLQRSIGNHAVSRLLTPAALPIQAKLQVGPVGDRYEEEADRIASDVMRTPISPTPPRVQDEGEQFELTGAAVQRMPAPPKITPIVQRSMTSPRFAANFSNLVSSTGATSHANQHAHSHGCSCAACGTVQRHHDGSHQARQGLNVRLDDERVQRNYPHGTTNALSQLGAKAGSKLEDEDARVQRDAHGKGCSCGACSHVQRQHDAPAKDGSFQADDGLEGQVKQLAGRGRPLAEPVRREMEGRFGGADFGQVRIHTGTKANTLNRSMQANAFTYRNEIAFAGGKFNPGSQQGKQLLAHELTHNLQQTGGTSVQRDANRSGHGRGCSCTGCRPTTAAAAKVQRAQQPGGVIQRHASWEHRLLGDVEPEDLAKLGRWQDPDAENEDEEIEIGNGKVTKKNITHVIKQELNRLKVWQQNPPQGASTEDAVKLMGEDEEWQVKLVAIPSLSKPNVPPLIVTYGELNTLADFYGSVQELKMADPVKRQNVAQSVRNQSYEKLLGIYMQLTNRTEQAAKEKLGLEGLTFAGSFDITDAIKGEVAQMMIDKKGQLDKYSSYGSTLARNACHFAPESWHSWEDYHDKARKVAKEAFDLSEEAKNLPEEDEVEVQPLEIENAPVQSGGSGMFSFMSSLPFGSSAPPKQVSNDVKKPVNIKDQIEEKVNEALILNGFGDHYLQDSYAAGHLINKTQIMQWYVQWLDKNPSKLTYTTDTSWHQFQAMAYDQDGLVDREQYNKAKVGRRTIKGQEVSTAHNPQMVENTQETQQGNIGWEGRFEMLGLKMPPSIKANTPALKLLLWMQRNSGYLTAWTWRELKDKERASAPKGFFGKLKSLNEAPPHGMDAVELMEGLAALLDDQIVFMSSGTRYDMAAIQRNEDVELFQDTNKFELRKEYIVSTIGGGDFKRASSEAEQGNMGRYNRMMKATVYKDYVKFMQDAFLQKSTNALHDYFCLNGLRVLGADGHSVFKIYGDNAMLNKESAKGVKESGETSRKSRDAIMEIALSGQENNDKSTQTILDRFPAKVELEDNSIVTLDEWHNDGELQKVAETRVFPTLNTAKDFMAGVSSGKPLGAISKDEEVHGGESF